MPRKKKIPFANLNELHTRANSILKTAILSERQKRWTKVVQTYTLLLTVIDREFLPDDYEPPASYGLLMYEVHYHLGVAYQHRQEHKKAASHFTKAINAISIPKNGCTAGCSTNTCLLTPLHARRAFALATTGNNTVVKRTPSMSSIFKSVIPNATLRSPASFPADLSGAMRDSERAVVLDSRNPDTLCVRALVRSTRDEGPLAIRDVDAALQVEPNHLASLILRGALSRPLYAAWSDLYQPLDNEFHRKAASLNPDTKPFLNVVNFKDPLVLTFYNRFLHNLSVPHTVTTINLTPDKPSRKQLEKNQSLYRLPSARRRVQSAEERSRLGDAFKCGAPLPADTNRTSALRRHDYGEAVRKHLTRPQTAQEYLDQICKLLQQKHAMSAAGRSESTITSPFLSRNHLRSADSKSRVSSLSSFNRQTTTKSTKRREFTIESPANYTIPVFQPVNIKDAPRMYYRPWKGDRLPTAETKPRKPTLAFY